MIKINQIDFPCVQDASVSSGTIPQKSGHLAALSTPEPLHLYMCCLLKLSNTLRGVIMGIKYVKA